MPPSRGLRFLPPPLGGLSREGWQRPLPARTGPRPARFEQRGAAGRVSAGHALCQGARPAQGPAAERPATAERVAIAPSVPECPPGKRRQGLFGCPLPWPSPGAFCGFAVGTPAAGATMRALVTFFCEAVCSLAPEEGVGARRECSWTAGPQLTLRASFSGAVATISCLAEGARGYHPGKRRIPEVVLAEKRTLFPYRAQYMAFGHWVKQHFPA